MRNHPRWSRIFAACAVLTMLVGVVSMFGYVELFGLFAIGGGLLTVGTNYSHFTAIFWTSYAWDAWLWSGHVPHLSWQYGVGLPLWMPAVGFAALAWFTRAMPPGCCAVCGYNLTGNVSGKCPECGTQV